MVTLLDLDVSVATGVSSESEQAVKKKAATINKNGIFFFTFLFSFRGLDLSERNEEFLRSTLRSNTEILRCAQKDRFL